MISCKTHDYYLIKHKISDLLFTFHRGLHYVLLHESFSACNTFGWNIRFSRELSNQLDTRKGQRMLFVANDRFSGTFGTNARKWNCETHPKYENSKVRSLHGVVTNCAIACEVSVFFVCVFVMDFLKGIISIFRGIHTVCQSSRVRGFDRCFEVADR